MGCYDHLCSGAGFIWLFGRHGLCQEYTLSYDSALQHESRAPTVHGLGSPMAQSLSHSAATVSRTVLRILVGVTLAIHVASREFRPLARGQVEETNNLVEFPIGLVNAVLDGRNLLSKHLQTSKGSIDSLCRYRIVLQLKTCRDRGQDILTHTKGKAGGTAIKAELGLCAGIPTGLGTKLRRPTTRLDTFKLCESEQALPSSCQ